MGKLCRYCGFQILLSHHLVQYPYRQGLNSISSSLMRSEFDLNRSMVDEATADKIQPMPHFHFNRLHTEESLNELLDV